MAAKPGGPEAPDTEVAQGVPELIEVNLEVGGVKDSIGPPILFIILKQDDFSFMKKHTLDNNWVQVFLFVMIFLAC